MVNRAHLAAALERTFHRVATFAALTGPPAKLR